MGSIFGEPATESPMETHLRMLLVLAGLPKPKVQASLQDEHGSFAVRPDIYTPSIASLSSTTASCTKTRSPRTTDGRIVSSKPATTCFTAGDVLNTTTVVVALVRRALSAAVYGAGS
jgi:hypothetical protein